VSETDIEAKEGTAPAAKTSRARLFVLLPLFAFLGLAAVFAVQLMSGKNASVLPSALIGKPAPATALEPIPGLMKDGRQVPGLDPLDFSGHLTLVNVFASWCAPCREEQPVLMQLSGDKRFRMVGFNYKDKPANALAFLNGLGNPFEAVGSDPKGVNGIEWGVYGVPETYLVGPKGIILYKHVGPFTEASVKDDLMPAVEKALKGIAAGS
jgi:cytochrome c biogenesis protein CcmG/thiol:disulfide interchange protein DsbE